MIEEANITSINEVLIRDGQSGGSKAITDKANIDEFITSIETITFSPLDDQQQHEGWSYGITLYDSDQQFEFTLGNINGIYYDSSPDIYPIVDAFYEQLP